MANLGASWSHFFTVTDDHGVSARKTKVGVQLVRSFSRLTRDRKEWATKQFVLPKLKISESTKVFLGSF